MTFFNSKHEQYTPTPNMESRNKSTATNNACPYFRHFQSWIDLDKFLAVLSLRTISAKVIYSVSEAHCCLHSFIRRFLERI
jgi:hypothetical protein